MFCTTSKTEGEVGPVKLIYTPSNSLLTIPMRWFSAARFGVRVSVTFHLTHVHINFSSISVDKWPPFGKLLLTRFIICSLCILDYL